MKDTLYFLFLIIILFAGCRKDDPVAPVVFNGIYGIENYDQALEELKEYAIFGVYTDGVSKLYLEKDVADYPYLGEIFVKYRSDINEERSDGGVFYIGDIENIYNEYGSYEVVGGPQSNTPEMGEVLKGIFGSDTRFRLVRDGETIYDKTIYIPEEMQITEMNSFGVEGSSSFNKINRDDFDFHWPANGENDNGVLIVMKWHGHTYDTPINELGGGDIHYKAAWFDDTGYAKMPVAFFEGLPSRAIFSLDFMRGSFEIVRGADGREYKIYGLSEDSKDFMLQN